jgi:hypothetical protein
LNQLSQPAIAGKWLPGPEQLQILLPAGTVNACGMPIRFRPGSSIPGVPYEEHIYQTGEVSTREDSWHDLFNALVWSAFPCLKAALNAAHHRAARLHTGPGRGPVRDALTLFDECGLILVSTDRSLLEALSLRDWQRAFVERRPAWQEHARILVCGHALLEKFLRPYKAMTAHAVLIAVTSDQLEASGGELQATVDTWLAEAVSRGRILGSPADLSPLPVMGIPGWWREASQDEAFYNDPSVFRVASSSSRPVAPIFTLESLREF